MFECTAECFKIPHVTMATILEFFSRELVWQNNLLTSAQEYSQVVG